MAIGRGLMVVVGNAPTRDSTLCGLGERLLHVIAHCGPLCGLGERLNCVLKYTDHEPHNPIANTCTAPTKMCVVSCVV